MATTTVRCRALRGFLISLGSHAAEGDELTLERPFFQFLKGANAVEELPAVDEAAAADAQAEADAKAAADAKAEAEAKAAADAKAEAEAKAAADAKAAANAAAPAAPINPTTTSLAAPADTSKGKKS